MKKIILTILLCLSLAYPVLADTGTFGYTTQGGTSDTSTVNNAYVYVFTSPADISAVTSASGYFNKFLIDGKVKICVWLVSGGILKGCTGEISVTGNGLYSGSLYANLSPSTDYLLGFISGGALTQYYDAGELNTGAVDTTNNYTTPANFVINSVNSNKLSVYMTYNTIAQGDMQIGSGTVQIGSNTLQISN